jgi:hypothetical protein
MASKKTGNLAALAALAGLAYMATRGKGEDKTKDVVKSKSMDVKPVGVKPVDVKPVEAKPVDLGEIRDEEGTLSTLRRNTETGELYDSGVQNAADRRNRINANVNNPGYSAGMKKGGAVKKMASDGMASKRGDGIAQRGKTKGTQIKMKGGK